MSNTGAKLVDISSNQEENYESVITITGYNELQSFYVQIEQESTIDDVDELARQYGLKTDSKDTNGVYTIIVDDGVDLVTVDFDDGMQTALYSFAKGDEIKFYTNETSEDGASYYVINEEKADSQKFESAQDAMNEVLGIEPTEESEDYWLENDEEEEDTFDYGSMEKPHKITGNDIPDVSSGEYVIITAPAHVRSTSNGRIKVGGNDTGPFSKSGIELYVQDNKGNDYYIEAYEIKAGKFKKLFYDHAPVDFSYEPGKSGETKHSGCKVTIKGCIDRLNYVGEDHDKFIGFSFDRDAVIEKVELYY